MAAINKWHSIQVDFIQAYPQSTIKYELHMELLKGFKNKELDGRTHILQLLKNMYEHNQSGKVCNHHLNNALRQVGFKKSAMDECIWYKDETIFFYYVDEIISMGLNSKVINREIENIKKEGLNI